LVAIHLSIQSYRALVSSFDHIARLSHHHASHIIQTYHIVFLKKFDHCLVKVTENKTSR